MIRIVSEKITENMPGVVLASHGRLAEGVLNAVHMIYGACDNLAVVGLEDLDNVDEWGEELKRTIELFPAGAVILVDLFGGTPCNQCLLKTVEQAKNRELVSLIAGMNLGMVLEVLAQRETAGFAELTAIAAEAGKSAVSDCLMRFRPLSV